eukprot:6190542-Pleurochrysis_carterae.AAC.2
MRCRVADCSSIKCRSLDQPRRLLVRALTLSLSLSLSDAARFRDARTADAARSLRGSWLKPTRSEERRRCRGGHMAFSTENRTLGAHASACTSIGPHLSTPDMIV